MAMQEKLSKTFHPSVSCNFRDLEGEELQQQNEDRELAICGSGLDIHYKYNIIQSTNPEEPSLMKFNPRMNSPAVPASYLGKSLSFEEELNPLVMDDCLERSKKLGKKKPYYEAVYERYDPRRFTSTVVIRDYVCKQPIEITNLGKLAKAVLNEFPDEYVTYLANFVDEMFGSKMRAFLKSSAERYMTILNDKEELNRISWGFYYAIAKPCDEDGQLRDTDVYPDGTMFWSKTMSKTLKELTMASTPRSEVLSASDMIDLEPCIRQHVETLQMMHDGCKGFGTSELHARLMLEYANLQGRNLMDDLMLSEDGEGPDYNKVTLKVPTNLFHYELVKGKESKDSSMTGELFSKMTKPVESLARTQMLDLPVGCWGGNVANSTGLTFSDYITSDYRWGWGHACNVFQKESNSALPGYLPYKLEKDPGTSKSTISMKADNSQFTEGLFAEDDWGTTLWTKRGNIIDKTPLVKDKTLSSLLEMEAAARSEKLGYRSAFKVISAVTVNGDADRPNEVGTESAVYNRKISEEPKCADGSIGLRKVPVFTLPHHILLGEKCIKFKNDRVFIPATYFLSPTVFKKEATQLESYAKFFNQDLKNLADFVHKAHAEGQEYVLKVPPDMQDLESRTFKDTFMTGSYRSGSTNNYVRNLLENNPLKENDTEFEKFVRFINGMPDYSRNMYLIPSMKATFHEFSNLKHSLRSRAMYRLKDPSVLRTSNHLDARLLNGPSERDSCILKLSFIRQGLQYSYGMHTAAMVFEELLDDPLLIYLAVLDARRLGAPMWDTTKPFDPWFDQLGIGKKGRGAFVTFMEDKDINIDETVFKKYETELGFGAELTGKDGAFNHPRLQWYIDHEHEIDTLILKFMLKQVTARLKTLFKHVDEYGTKVGGFDYKDFYYLHNRVEMRKLVYTDPDKVLKTKKGIKVGRHFGSNPVFAMRLLNARRVLDKKSCEALHHKMSVDSKLNRDYEGHIKTIHEPQKTPTWDAANSMWKVSDEYDVEFYEDKCAEDSRYLKELKAKETQHYLTGKEEDFEEELWKLHDVRCLYTSDLESYKYQLCENKPDDSEKTLKKALKNMSEVNLVENVLKEMEHGFDNTMYYILLEMLHDQDFTFCRTHKAKKKTCDKYKGVPAVNYRALDESKDYTPPITQLQVDGSVRYCPYTTDQQVDTKKKCPKALTSSDNYLLLPMEEGYDDTISARTDATWNNFISGNGAMLFSMFDAAGFAWDRRKFRTPGDTNRPSFPKKGHQDKMHYWSRILTESFVAARQVYAENKKYDVPWELAARLNPERAFRSSQIGALCERTWKEQFPLLSPTHALRAKMGKMRSLSIMWYELKSYCKDTLKGSVCIKNGPWIPLPVTHQMHFMKRKGLFDEKVGVPLNPWNMRNESGLFDVFNQSYHSPYTTTIESSHLNDWLKTAVPYKKPQETTYKPFTQYGGTPVSADFVHHLVEKPNEDDEFRLGLYKNILNDRYGITEPIKMGKMFNDTGLLQDMFSYEYSPSSSPLKDDKEHVKLEKNECCALRISSFMAYARTHAIMALGSSNLGTEEISLTLAARNYFRLYVDTYKCAGFEKNADGVPVIMGYSKKNVQTVKNGESAIVLYAGTLNCMNAQMAKFCASPANANGKVCELYKQLYLNDATLLFERHLRLEREEHRYQKNFNNAFAKDGSLTKLKFADHVRKIDKEHISFLQHIIIGMLYQLGYTDNFLPLHLLEPRDVYVSPDMEQNEDEAFVGQDYLSPQARTMVKDLDFGSANLDRIQMAVLSLIPPDARAIGMMRLAETPELIDTSFLKKQFEKKVEDGNKNVWKNYASRVVRANYGTRFLQGQNVKLAFDEDNFKDPRKEAEALVRNAGLGVRLSTNKHRDSEYSLTQRSSDLRQDTKTVSKRLSDEDKQALMYYDRLVKAKGGNKFEALVAVTKESNIPPHFQKVLHKKYMSEAMA